MNQAHVTPPHGLRRASRIRIDPASSGARCAAARIATPLILVF